MELNAIGAGDLAVAPGPQRFAVGNTYTGDSGDNTQNGTRDDDTFNFDQGGEDTLNGEKGNDTFNFGGALDQNDSVNGGAGNDTLNVTAGNAVLSVLTNTLLSIENMNISPSSAPGNQTFGFFTLNSTVAAGATMNIAVTGESFSHFVTLTFDGENESDGHFNITPGGGDDNITGGQQSDTFHLDLGGNDTIDGQRGNDVFDGGAGFSASDSLNGGAGSDTLNLSVDTSGTLGADTLKSIENIVLENGHTYNLTLDDGNVAAHRTLTIDGSHLDASHGFEINGLAETNGNLIIKGGAADDLFRGGDGADHLFGGAGSDSFEGSEGNDVIDGGGGDDRIFAGNGADMITPGPGHDIIDESLGVSVSATFDTIIGFDAKDDEIDLDLQVNAIDHKVTHGELRDAHFDADLAAALDKHHLKAGDAVFFTPDSGDLAGRIFLVIDENGVAGYQHGDDVIELKDPTHFSHFDLADLHFSPK